jgi:hypothetical protein
MWAGNIVSLHLTKFEAHRSACYEIKELHDGLRIEAFMLSNVPNEKENNNG